MILSVLELGDSGVVRAGVTVLFQDPMHFYYEKSFNVTSASSDVIRRPNKNPSKHVTHP